MKDAGILEGDYVVVRPQDTAQDGDIVVALLGEEATVKRFFRESDHIRLQPENDAMEPIRSKEVKVLGRVVGLLQERLSLRAGPSIAAGRGRPFTGGPRARYLGCAGQAAAEATRLRGKSGHQRARWSRDRPGETRGKVPQKQTADVRRPT